MTEKSKILIKTHNSTSDAADAMYRTARVLHQSARYMRRHPNASRVPSMNMKGPLGGGMGRSNAIRVLSVSTLDLLCCRVHPLDLRVQALEFHTLQDDDGR
ncbi:hypothetical protein H257_11576 [Aphanomyces astaci]|uniref:Uncharacterized protein n=1 Tax=Aphanomyces astaci TaxID=112090 RepID=W4G2Z5_APHAT|nr:hypothetical protein H257_11576 [Aphanomyces astaci]ETV73434.1 hypothetical protein H257_11576 [Aphanomyces astaci]|eukprot:XP_009836860.1 hypothetical protein H257_11576 [Aphanomyces astaci]